VWRPAGHLSVFCSKRCRTAFQKGRRRLRRRVQDLPRRVRALRELDPPRESTALLFSNATPPIESALVTTAEREPIDPARVRKIPSHFAWADHRPRDVIGTLTLEETAPLFFLHLAADKNGGSYRGDAALAKKPRLREGLVVSARAGLIAHGLVAYRYPLYQLLPLPEATP